MRRISMATRGKEVRVGLTPEDYALLQYGVENVRAKYALESYSTSKRIVAACDVLNLYLTAQRELECALRAAQKAPGTKTIQDLVK